MKNAVFVFLGAAFVFLMCVFSPVCTAAAADAVGICINVLIPSLLVFFVVCSLLVKMGFAAYVSKVAKYITIPLFNVSGEGALAFVMGIISGYPSGAVCVCDLYKEGFIEKNEAERLLAFCNNSGPLFILGAVGAGMLQNRAAGVVLYAVHILSALICGFVFRFYKKGDGAIKKKLYIKPMGFNEAMSTSVAAASQTMLAVCTYTIFFAVVIALVKMIPFGKLICPFIEITNGCIIVVQSHISAKIKLCLLSSVIGFSGIGVCMQVMSVLSKTDLRCRNYFIGKIIQAAVSFVLMYMYLTF